MRGRKWEKGDEGMRMKGERWGEKWGNEDNEKKMRKGRWRKKDEEIEGEGTEVIGVIEWDKEININNSINGKTEKKTKILLLDNKMILVNSMKTWIWNSQKIIQLKRK